MKLFRRLILRPLRRDPVRTLLTVLSVALGVGVVIAIELAGAAATGSFESSLTTLTGRVDFLITANGGVDPKYLGTLATLPLDARFSPVIEKSVKIEGKGYTTVYAIDFIAGVAQAPESRRKTTGESESGAAVSQELKDQLGAAPLRIGDKTYRIEKAIPSSTPWAAVDIANAEGPLDRIEVFIGKEDPEVVRRAIRAVIPPTYELETPGARSAENQRMLGAFRWNLRVLSYISLLVGAFLIYNTVAVSVVRRRTEIGILRAIGISARGVLSIFLAEAALLGMLGAIVGIFLGRAMAAAIVGMISGTVNALFTTSTPGDIALTWKLAAGAILAGTSVSFFSALIPAREAARAAPADAMRREAREHRTKLNVRRDVIIAAICAAAALLLNRFGYAAALLAVASAAFLSPGFVLFSLRTLKFRSASGLVAARTLAAALSRTSIVVTALAVAIAMMVSVGIMVGSFRETVQVWLESQLRADIYLRAAGPAAAGIFPPIDDAVPGLIRSTSGAGDVDIFHAFTFRYEGLRATFGAGDFAIVKRHRSLRFLSGGFADGEAIVSEPFANKHRVKTGDTLSIPLGATRISLRVSGIYYDYASDQGYVIVDRALLLRYLPNQPITNVAVYGKTGTDPTALRRALEKRLQNYPVVIAPNEELRRNAVEIFDRTFAITWALEAVAILVAMLGAANSLLALVLDRKREIGLIRYLGGAREQVRRMVLTQAGLIGLLAGSLGLALGMALSLLLIFVINKQSFGWTIQFHPPVPLIAGALLLVWLVTVVAGIYPARFAARLEPSEAVHEE